MKKIIFLTISAVIFSSINIYAEKVKYIYCLDSVLVSVNNEAVISKYQINKGLLHYEDDYIDLRWEITDVPRFNLTNKAQSTVKLIWNNAVYQDDKGRTQRVMHEGIKFIDSSKDIPESTLLPNGSIDDTVLPVEHIIYANGWKIYPLFSENVKRKYLKNATDRKGKRVKIMLPFMIGNNLHEYQFIFKIVDVEVK